MPFAGDSDPDPLPGLSKLNNSGAPEHGHALPHRNEIGRVNTIEHPEGFSPSMLNESQEKVESSLERFGQRSNVKLGKESPGRSPKTAPTKAASSRNAARPEPSAINLQGIDDVFAQIAMWIDNERDKVKSHETKPEVLQKRSDHHNNTTNKPELSLGRRSPRSTNGSVALDQLEEIVRKGMALTLNGSSVPRRPSHRSQRSTLLRKLARQSTTGGSDTECLSSDGDVVVPHCDVVLDNTQTLAGSVNLPGSNDKPSNAKDASLKLSRAWSAFKYEILRLAHTLRLKGWRRVPLEMSQDLAVERLSGALTNSVYVVSPPSQIPDSEVDRCRTESWRRFRKPPIKLLLRIYGPQVDHLIDRKTELQILRRLSRKHIGPRLLGTFQNGRFEEYFYANALKPEDLRDPDNFRQIAKRMRELHMGIELLDAERKAGPFVWQNWDKWFSRCERIVTYVDRKILAADNSLTAKFFKRRGLLCAVEWGMFRRTVERYRRWLVEQYGGPEALRERLVFTHNDTQYGNILRLEPSNESPLLLPANKHKQLVVIDFEYANANTVGYEFATHFTEWCYNYHAEQSYLCNTALYPSIAAQRQFIKAYISHRPDFASTSDPETVLGGSILTRSPSSSLIPQPNEVATSSLPSLSLTPSAFPEGTEKINNNSQSSKSVHRPSTPQHYSSTSMANSSNPRLEAQVDDLMHETRLWRLACSAKWIAWGIVQARVPGFEEETSPENRPTADKEAHSQSDEPKEGDEEEGFDYLSYAHERSLLFWGDCVQLGFVAKSELPADVQKRLKIVER